MIAGQIDVAPDPGQHGVLAIFDGIRDASESDQERPNLSEVRGLRRALGVLSAYARSGKGGLGTMISTGQILAAGLVTALGVGIAGWTVRWPLGALLLAGAGAFALILAWRGTCNHRDQLLP